VDGEEVEAVHRHAGHAEAGGAVGDVVAGHRPVRGGSLGIAVVLGDEDARQVPYRGQVHRLEHRALVGAAVAEEGHRHAPAALELGSQRGTGGERRAGTDDTVGAEHALLQVGDVHGAALALADAGLLAIDLGHHPVYVHTLGDAVAMAAVGGGDAILVGEVRHDAGGGCLLAGIEVDESGDLAGGELHVEPFFEGTDGAHDPVGMQQLVSGQVSGHIVFLRGCLQGNG
jgi:hypothetical protein